MKAIKAGIFSYILKPWEADYLQSELEKAVDIQRAHAQNSEYAKIMEDELKWAGEMQRAILKPNALRSDGVEFRTSYRPVPGLYCGGDYYDVINIGVDRYLMLIGDVAGHGVKAAFVTGILKAVIFPEYVRNTLGKGFSPADFLNWLNERMNFELRQTSSLIITFFVGVLDRAAMTFTYANAGQDHPFIVSGGVPRELPISGSALGFAHSVMHTEKTEFLNRGDVIIIFTDGLVEAGSRTGRKDIVSMKEALEHTAYGPDYHKRIMEAALAKAGSENFEDDVAVVTATLV
jgi:sigma-B regulation protein RsbU (phosphoserine phosphatase)